MYFFSVSFWLLNKVRFVCWEFQDLNEIISFSLNEWIFFVTFALPFSFTSAVSFLFLLFYRLVFCWISFHVLSGAFGGQFSLVCFPTSSFCLCFVFPFLTFPSFLLLLLSSIRPSVVAYVLAPLPNLLCKRCAAGLDDSYQRFRNFFWYQSSSSLAWLQSLAFFCRGFLDAGYFITGLLIISGFGKWTFPNNFSYLLWVKYHSVWNVICRCLTMTNYILIFLLVALPAVLAHLEIVRSLFTFVQFSKCFSLYCARSQ